MDEAFHIPWENGKSISHFCKRPQYAVIECTTKEPMKNWNLRTRMIFSDLGTYKSCQFYLEYVLQI